MRHHHPLDLVRSFKNLNDFLPKPVQIRDLARPLSTLIEALPQM